MTTTITEARRASKAKYYQENRSKILEQHKEYRLNNSDKVREMHRRYREANEGHTYEDSVTGYVLYIGYNHPAATPSGVSRYHRIVLWDKLQGQDAPCHWCGGMVTWSLSFPESQDALVVDHLNGIRNDNRPENLVPSHNRCNLGRIERSSIDWGTCTASWENGQCERDGAIHVFGEQVQVCMAHYYQNRGGKAFEPIRTYLVGGDEMPGRVCNGPCGEFKLWDAFYMGTRGTRFSKCKVCVREQRAAARAGGAA